MKLVTGGAWQGKLNFGFHLLGYSQIETELYADGERDSYQMAWEKPVIYQFHAYIKRLMAEEKNPESFVIQLMKKNPHAVVITNELGSGIVPVSPLDRAYREAAGRAGQTLASYSTEVYRVLAGIGTRIK